MRYREHPPHPALRPFIECLWTLDVDADEPRVPRRIFPDGRVEMVLNHGTPYRQLGPEGAAPQPGAFVVGQTTAPLHLLAAGRVGVVGIRVRPEAAGAFLGLPQDEIAGTIVPLADVWGERGRALANAVGEGRSDAHRLRELERALLDRASRAPPADPLVRAAIARLTADGGRSRIARIAAGLGLSPRQLERRFRTAVGVGPKLFARLVRFQDVFRALEREPAGGWVDVALECGYADQAHLAREFAAFTGLTPSEYRQDGDALAELFTRTGRAVSHSFKTAVLRAR
jgi:AraC-like DNA-binding protein